MRYMRRGKSEIQLYKVIILLHKSRFEIINPNSKINFDKNSLFLIKKSLILPEILKELNKNTKSWYKRPKMNVKSLESVVSKRSFVV